jgi:hypothetical protein
VSYLDSNESEDSSMIQFTFSSSNEILLLTYGINSDKLLLIEKEDKNNAAEFNKILNSPELPEEKLAFGFREVSAKINENIETNKLELAKFKKEFFLLEYDPFYEWSWKANFSDAGESDLNLLIVLDEHSIKLIKSVNLKNNKIDFIKGENFTFFSSLGDVQKTKAAYECVQEIDTDEFYSLTYAKVNGGLYYSKTYSMVNGIYINSYFDGETVYDWKYPSDKGTYLKKGCVENKGKDIREYLMPMSTMGAVVKCKPIKEFSFEIPEDVHFLDKCDAL